MTWSLLIGGAGLMLRHRELLLPFRCAQIPTYSSRSGSLLWTIWLDMDNLWHRCVIWKRPTSNRSSCFHSTDVSNRLEAGPKPSRVPLLTSDLQDGSRQYVRQLSDCLLNSFAVYHSLFFHIITSQCIFFSSKLHDIFEASCISVNELGCLVFFVFFHVSCEKCIYNFLRAFLIVLQNSNCFQEL